ncbi:hypothetical protein GOV11_04530, partial [Candidatus Woesearchaeota archaeon]|nr:hypothetical protein [Candidatus Woesearchaeota archaeon]
DYIELNFTGASSSIDKRKRGRPKRTYGDKKLEVALSLLPHLSPPSENEDVIHILSPELEKQSEGKSKGPLRLSFTPFQLKCEKKITKKGDKERKIRLDPLSRINSQRIYRTTHLYGKRPSMSTKPPHKGLLEIKESDYHTALKSEFNGMKRVIRFLERDESVTDEWKEFLSALRGIVTGKKGILDPHHILYTSSIIRQFLETHPQSNTIWSILKKKRSWMPSGLSGEQHEHLDKVRTNYPDIFLIIGNHLFLLVLAATRTIHHTTVSTHLVEELWDYVLPWQLVQLGLIPRYHDEHRTGESILHRGRIYESLMNRAEMLGVLLEKMHNVSDVRFGQSIMVDSRMTGRQPAIWLSCQSKPGHHEMDVILLPIEEDSARGAEDVIKRLVRDKPYWGESDITRLSQYAEIAPDFTRTPIMFAEQKGIKGLWALSRTRRVWTPIGRVEYYIRKKEMVTLIRSLTIRQDFSLQPIPLQDVRELPGTITDQMDAALEVIRVAYSKCIPVSCKVSIDLEEKMFIISFDDNRGLMDSENLQLLVKRTVDVLEVLRRPDIECESVNVSEHQFVWNRFKDIQYVGDAFLLKQWVERKDPYKYTSISLPPTAEHFIELSRTSGLKISVHHDASVCPLRNSSFEELVKRKKSSDGKVKIYLQQIEGPEGQPDNLITESIYSHGLCWRVKVEGEGVLPEGIKSIEEIALKGPKLRTLLETGSLILQTNEDEWSIYDFDIPDPSELPREFRESIHLMGIRRRGQVVIEEPMFPGTYIIEEWTPD